MKEVILFGGSFDPVHDGHLDIAKEAINQLSADELWFIPAALSPFKEESTSFKHRTKMLEIMLEDSPNLKISDIENTLPSPSYSIDTVKALNKMHPETQFYWLIGSDQIESLHLWKNFEELNELVEFVVYERPGYDEKHAYKTIEGSYHEVSSTEIRNGTSLKTKARVLKYMMEENLYLKTMTKTRLSEFRYEHTLRVTELALNLAKHHNLDEKKMTLIAMFHDYAKEDDDLLKVMQDFFPNKLEEPKAFYHAYAASVILRNDYHIDDQDVLEAIENHVGGTLRNPYAMCLYIADKCEPGRNFDASDVIKLSNNNLAQGFDEIKAINEEYLRSKK